MSLALSLWIGLVGVFAAAVSSTLGMAGGSILLSALALAVPLKEAIPIHGWAQFCSNAGRVFAYWKYIEWKYARRFLILTPVGAFLGVQLVARLESRWLELGLGIMILWMLYGPKPKALVSPPLPFFYFLGFVSSFFGMLIGGSGPMIAPFFLGLNLEKKRLIATKAICQAAVQFLKIPAFAMVVGVNFSDAWGLLAGLTAATAVGTWIGTKVIDRMRDDWYEKVLASTLTILALHFVYKGVVGSL